MEIGPLTALEWPWLLERATVTGWEQLSPAQQAHATPAQVAAHVQQMLRHALGQPGSLVLVARAQGAPVGYIAVAVMPDELTGLPAGLVLDLWVEPPWRGRGISYQLTAAGEAHCRALGLRSLRRAISVHNVRSLRQALRDGCQVERCLVTKYLT